MEPSDRSTREHDQEERFTPRLKSSNLLPDTTRKLVYLFRKRLRFNGRTKTPYEHSAPSHYSNKLLSWDVYEIVISFILYPELPGDIKFFMAPPIIFGIKRQQGD